MRSKMSFSRVRIQPTLALTYAMTSFASARSDSCVEFLFKGQRGVDCTRDPAETRFVGGATAACGWSRVPSTPRRSIYKHFVLESSYHCLFVRSYTQHINMSGRDKGG